jgi:hypothetical protein
LGPLPRTPRQVAAGWFPTECADLGPRAERRSTAPIPRQGRATDLGP